MALKNIQAINTVMVIEIGVR